jgi:hypothetical protein
MKRLLTEVNVGDHHTKLKRYSLVLEDELSDRDLRVFLQSLVDTPTLMLCGLAYPKQLAIHHNGTSWVLQAQAEHEQP